jgi:hypothetical protein
MFPRPETVLLWGTLSKTFMDQRYAQKKWREISEGSFVYFPRTMCESKLFTEVSNVRGTTESISSICCNLGVLFVK